jgi:biotin operon repressor
LGLLHHWGGQIEEAETNLLAARALLSEIKDINGEMGVLMWLIENMILQKRFPEAHELALYGQQTSLKHQLPDEEFQFQRLIATVQFETGHLPAALEILQECLPESGQHLGVEINGFYRFHLLHYKILKALTRDAEALEALSQASRYNQIELQSYPASERPGWRKAIPVVNEILTLYEQLLEHKITVQLAAQDAPIGRSLQAHEYRQISWTIRTTADDQILDKTKRRQHQLERLCFQAQAQGAAPTVEDLAKALDSSVATIKRDLAALRANGVNLNTRGARGSTSNLQSDEPSTVKLV